MRVPGLLVVKHRLAKLALDQLLGRPVPFLRRVTRLQVFLQVELHHVLLPAQMAVEHGARLA